MSQIWKTNSGSGPLPPEVATSYILDENSPAIPAANILNVIGGFTPNENVIGIQTNNILAGDNSIIVELTNRIAGQVQTTDAATTTTLITMPYTVAGEGVFTFDIRISAYNVTDQLAASYWIQVGRRSDGVVGYSYGPFNLYLNEEDDGVTFMSAVIVNIPASFAALNQFGVTVNGLVGKTINWTLTGHYTFAGV